MCGDKVAGVSTLYACVYVLSHLVLDCIRSLCVELEQKSHTNVTLPHPEADKPHRQHSDLCQTVHWNSLSQNNPSGVVNGFNSHFWNFHCWSNRADFKAELKEIPLTRWPRSNNVFAIKSDHTALIGDQTRANGYFPSIWYDYCSIWLRMWGKIINSDCSYAAFAKVWWNWHSKTRRVSAPGINKHYICRRASFQTLRKDHTDSVSVERRRQGWVPVGTEEEERRLSNSEKSSFDVPLDALNRSKLPEKGTTHTHAHRQNRPNRQQTHTRRQMKTHNKYEWVWIFW